MNKDTVQGDWKELKGKIKSKWGKLTDDELNEAEGDMDRLEGIIQKKYGQSRDEVKKHLANL